MSPTVYQSSIQSQIDWAIIIITILITLVSPIWLIQLIISYNMAHYVCRIAIRF